MKILAAVLVALLLAGPAAAYAQASTAESRAATTTTALADTAVVQNSGDTVFFPILGYTPDTSFMFGASVLKFFYLDPPGGDARPSMFAPVVVVTAKSQYMIFAGLDLNWGGGRWHAGIMPSYIKFPDDFYGIGRDVDTEPLESFTPEQYSLEMMIEREVLGELRVGAGYRVMKHQVLESEPGGVIDSGSVTGGGRTVISAPGVQLAWDTRDHTWAPRRGSWFQTRAFLFREAWGSDLDWTEWTVDARGYLPVGGSGTLAGQALLVAQDGDVPFYRLPRLGGQDGLRGYSGGRFMDKAMAMARMEWRSGDVWGRLGFVAFAGVGDVAPRAGALTTSARLTTVGGGLRITLSREERVRIRMDFGLGKDDGGFFLSLGEAF